MAAFILVYSLIVTAVLAWTDEQTEKRLAAYYGIKAVGQYGCEALTEPLYGRLKFNDRKRSVRVVCDSGLDRYGSRVRTCVKGRWTGRMFSCVVPLGGATLVTEPISPTSPVTDTYDIARRLCPPLGELEHGRMFYSAETRKVGSSVTYLCEGDYIIEGASKRTCQLGRKWDGEPPVCMTVMELLEVKFVDKYAVATADSKVSKESRLSIGKSGLDMVFVLDTSASIGPVSLKKAKSFMKMIVKKFGVSSATDGSNGTRVAVVTFAAEAKVLFNLDDPDLRSVEAVCSKIDEVQTTGGGTNFMTALALVYRRVWLMKIKNVNRRKEGATRAVFFITDSEETSVNSSSTEIKRRAESLKNNEFEIFAIGVGRNIDHVALEDIASPPYTEHVFPIESFSDLDEITDTIAERNIDYGQCGISGNNYLVASSGNARPNSWPWLGWVSVNTKRVPRACGGTLVCSRYFVTAAHCLYAVDKRENPFLVRAKRILVYLSDHKLYKKDNTEVMVKVRRVLIHPNYTGDVTENGVRNYDVAILDFGINIENQPALNKQLRPICVASNLTGPGILTSAESLLNSRKYSDRDAGYVAGWGHSPTNMYDGSALPWYVLKQAKRKVQSDKRCGKKFPGINPDMFFCVGGIEESDTCRGDTGGPYMDMLPGKQFVMLGLALRTRNCAQPNEFSIFLNMLQEDIVSWMESILEDCNRTRKVKVTTDSDNDARDQGK